MSDVLAHLPHSGVATHSAKKSMTFRDITALLQDRKSMRIAIDQLAKQFANQKIDKVAGIESRGFIIGSALAYKLGVGFVLLRKVGKLPTKNVATSDPEIHEMDRLSVHTDAILPNERVLLVDDFIASGTTILAAVHLISQLKGVVAGCGFIINLYNLGGMQRLKKLDLNSHALRAFESD